MAEAYGVLPVVTHLRVKASTIHSSVFQGKVAAFITQTCHAARVLLPAS